MSLTVCDIPTFLTLARTVSRHSTCKMQLGAVLVKHGKPVALGFNQAVSHPKWLKGMCSTIHAEADAIRSAGKCSLKGSSIFVYRERKDGMPAMARPCANCVVLLKAVGVKWMWYSTAEYPFFQVERL